MPARRRRCQVDFSWSSDWQEGGDRAPPVGVHAVFSSRAGYSEAVIASSDFLRCPGNALVILASVSSCSIWIISRPQSSKSRSSLSPPDRTRSWRFCAHYHLHVMPSVHRCRNTKERWSAGCLSPRQRARRTTLPVPGRRKRFSEHSEKTSPTERVHGTTCETGRSHALCRRTPICGRSRFASFPATRRPVRHVSRDSFVVVQRAFTRAPPDISSRQV